ncbi:YugN family protein [Paenibacillus whitsoniae]|uniref:YugN-like family protein n=1 Tax=Paenibacillus whitsoniae TaxID=2496558 RepID=A0A430J8E8_9BACL|nr:YugN family protein [Paenibacillus whitsoniae]RTE06340.1 hypothetical protein EJQ19_23515 [Paenibacillus whitsoniae]
MRTVPSSIEHVKETFDSVRAQLSKFDFSLGGNWDYDHGYFDKSLDEANKVWLRIPVQVITGRIDGDSEATDALVEVGTPFVLNHVYNEGLDTSAEAETYGALVDQFQAPLDPDGHVEEKWVQAAKDVLKNVENDWFH